MKTLTAPAPDYLAQAVDLAQANPVGLFFALTVAWFAASRVLARYL